MKPAHNRAAMSRPVPEWAYHVTAAPGVEQEPALIEALHFERQWPSDLAFDFELLQDLFPVHEPDGAGGFVRRPVKGTLINVAGLEEFLRSLGGLGINVLILWVLLDGEAIPKGSPSVLDRSCFLPDYTKWMPVSVHTMPFTLYKVRLVMDWPWSAYARPPRLGEMNLLTWDLNDAVRKAFFPDGLPLMVRGRPGCVFTPATPALAAAET